MGLIANIEKKKIVKDSKEEELYAKKLKLLGKTNNFVDIKKEIEDKLIVRDKKEEFSMDNIRKIVDDFAIKEIMNSSFLVKRVPTGLNGLDDLMEGGFLQKSMVLIGGGAGSGKSIFSMQFLINGIERFNENGVYITFEQSEEDVLRDYDRFNWKIRNKVKEGKLVILSYTPEQVERFLESGGGIVRDIIEKANAKRVVIDSLTAFMLLYPGEMEKRRTFFRLYSAMNKWNCTTLMTSEQEPDPLFHKSIIVEFQADTVILLYNIRKGDVRERSMEIFKMRATQHTAKIFPLKIDDSGIVVYPEETVF